MKCYRAPGGFFPRLRGLVLRGNDHEVGVRNAGIFVGLFVYDIQ
jgi:hypothetical protein